jgi:glutamine cyclotransferase
VHRIIPVSILSAVVAALLPLAGTMATDGQVERLDWEVVSRRPHDPEAFSQGLQLDGDGRLFESTGQYGRSSLREVDPATGEVTRVVPLPDEYFGEGLAQVGDRLVQLTWVAGVATSWDAETFEPIETFEYTGEGWGLCYDGSVLIMSDGSDQLTYRDAITFSTIGSVAVTLDGEPRDRLNELECVDGDVWANVLGSDLILRIDPADGIVDGVLDLSGIVDPHPALANRKAVLNGIAYDSDADTYLVTGKLWPELIEIRLTEAN